MNKTNVFIVQDFVTHYRVGILNEISEVYKKNHRKLFVITNKLSSDIDYKIIKFEYILVKKITFLHFYLLLYLKEFFKYKPYYIIHQAELKIINIYILKFFRLFYDFKLIFWTHGYNKTKLNFLFQKIMNLADILLLYTPFRTEYYKFANKKCYYANNSLYFSTENEKTKKQLLSKKEKIKQEMGLGSKKVGIFCGRLYKNKKVDEVIKTFELLGNNYHLIIIGNGECETDLKNYCKKRNLENITFVGGINNFELKAKYFAISELGFLTGVIGLNIVDYFYWGLPLIGLEGEHSPEIYYLKNKQNGFLCKDLNEMCTYSKLLFNNDNLRKKMSNHALKTYNSEMHHSNMIKAFIEVIEEN